MSTIIVLIAAFIGVAALVGGTAMFFRGDVPSAVEDRLKNMASANVASGGGREVPKEAALLAAAMNDQPNFMEEFVARYFNLKKFLEEADSPIDATKLTLFTGLLAGGSAGLCLFTPMAWWVAPLVGMVLAPLPFVWLYMRRGSRLMKFAKQMPEALELISRALRAGHSLAAGFNLVATEMPAPLSAEFRRCYEEQNLGVPLEEALLAMANRVPNLDLRFFATAVILQRQTGGDLAEILDKIGHIVRERFKIYGQIAALTGEGRLSGIVLLALPPVLFVAMLRLNYNYIMMLFNDPMGQQMLAGGILMQLLGAVVIKKIITIKV